MKKNIRLVLFSLIFVLLCPFVFFACDDPTFEQVPYGASGADAESLIRDFNAAGDYMINRLGLKMKYETINTYTFYDTSSTQAQVVKDVITTTLGSSTDNPSIANITFTRYINGTAQNTQIDNYVKTTLEGGTNTQSYRYIFTQDHTAEEETYDKDRVEYNSNIQTLLTFYNSIIFEIKPEEVESIQQKYFEESTYYKLNSGIGSIIDDVSSIEAVNDRFAEDENLQENPQLFKLLTKSYHDAVENFYYEFSRNAPGYSTYYAIHYNIFNRDRQKYLNVSSITKLKSYGENVKTGLPDDVDEYVANNFMKTLSKENSYIVYSKVDDSDYDPEEEVKTKTLYSVARIGNDFSVRQDLYQNGAIASSNYYYLVYNKENDYTTYSIDLANETITKSKFSLDVAYFNFSLQHVECIEGIYQYSDEESYINISLEDNKISTINTRAIAANRDDDITLSIERYGSDYTVLPSSTFVTSIKEFELA